MAAGHDTKNPLSHHGAEKIAGWLAGWGVEPIAVAPPIVLLTTILAVSYDPQAVAGVITALAAISPIWLSLMLARYFWITWVHYIRYTFWFSHEYVLVEIQLPAEVEKTPLAMEAVLAAMWQIGGETSAIRRMWNGRFRTVWSFEIASNEGKIGYYLYMRKSWQQIVEARLYGQFPEAKIIEVEDYTRKIPFNLEEYSLWGCEFRKSDIDALPIKTYVDYQLDKNPDKPENSVDPMTNILELLNTMGPGEYYWVQIIARGHKGKDEWYTFPTASKFLTEGKGETTKLMLGAAARAKSLVGEDKVLQAQAAARGLSLLTDGEKKRLESIGRSLGKMVFECGVVAVYVCKKEKFDGVKGIMNTVRLWDTFRGQDVGGYNALGPARGMAGFDYPWQDYRQFRQNRIRKKMFFRYQNRAYFFVPYDQEPVYMSTEELATIWHFPSSVVKTPGLSRVPSRRAEAPRNLPSLPI